MLEDDDIPDLDGDDLGDHLLSDDLLMAEELSSSKPRGSKRISPPPIIRPKSTSDESEEGNMWSKDYADDEDIAEDEDDDYLGQKEQVLFTLNEAGGNTYEAGYMSSVGSQAPQQQRVEMGTVMPVPCPDIQKQSAAPKPISTDEAHHVDKQSGS